MSNVKDQKLLNLIKTIPVLSIVIFAIVLNLFFINDEREDSKQSIAKLRQEIVSTEKSQLKQNIENLYERIQYDRTKTESSIRNIVKERVYEAHAIASNLYEKNKEKPKAEIEALITQALRPVRFNNGRGYFFIYDIDGTNKLHPITPAYENTSLWDLKDVKGSYVIRDLSRVVETQQEGFHRFWFSKPGAEEHEFEKIGFVKSFEQLGWFIGTGEYISDVENELKRKTVEHISQIQLPNNGYIFVIDDKGVYLSHPNSTLIGMNRYTSRNNQDELFVQQIIEAGIYNKGYIEYFSSYTPEGLTSSEKISYVKYLSEWNWIIGTGVYKQDLNTIIEDQKALLEQQNSIQTFKLIAFTIVISMSFGLFSIVIARKLTSRFERYQHRITDDFNNLNSLKDKLEFSALHDSLTELPNRKLFEQTVNHYLAKAKENNKYLALMFVDLDDFKKINDLHGHAIGDTLLTHVSQKFLSVLSHHDTVSRFGGDEFVFCFPELNSIEEANDKAQLVIDSVLSSSAISGKIISTSCSAGLAIYPDHGETIDKLLSNADMALYKAKDLNKGCFQLFNNSLSEIQLYQQNLELHLSTALKNNEISIHYQPQIDFKTGQVFGVEALARWNNPDLGQIPPSIFIAKAEEIGVIDEIGDYIIKQACRELYAVSPNGVDEIHLSINISPSRITDSAFVDTFTNLVDDSGINRHRVTLEITENVLIDDLEHVAPALTQLRFRQFSVALDDFGTGFSSLGYLNQLPINEIKIDRSFVEKLPHNKQSQSLVNAIMAISEALKLRVVAEGIETPEQSNWLEKCGVGLAQGYLFAKPMPISDLSEKYIVTSKIQKRTNSTF